jgi:hypothetical protein
MLVRTTWRSVCWLKLSPQLCGAVPHVPVQTEDAPVRVTLSVLQIP